MVSINPTYQKFRKGQPLTDEELSDLINHHTKLLASLSIIEAPEYQLVEADVTRQLERLLGYQRARKEY